MAEQTPPHPHPEGPREPPSVTGLVEQLIRDLTELVRSEGRLAKAEVLDTMRRTMRGVGMILGGGAVFLLAGIVLVQALVVALAAVIGPGWASLVVGLALAVVGFILFQAGRSSLRHASLFPERTIEQISRDGRLAQEQI